MAIRRHHTDEAELITAWLHGTTSRWASKHGWTGPIETEMDEALAELRERAIDSRGVYRLDLLHEVAGVCLGAAPIKAVEGPLWQGKAELLLSVIGADLDETVLRKWVEEGVARLTPANPRS